MPFPHNEKGPAGVGACRACGGRALTRVLDLGNVPAADHFPFAGTPRDAGESDHPLSMTLCAACGLAQLASDDTESDEPRGVEPRALRDQARLALRTVARHGWLDSGRTVREFASPHGGNWTELLVGHGFGPPVDPLPGAEPAACDIVLDSFGMMHERDQRAAVARRAAATSTDGTLLLQFHSLAAIVSLRQWNALRHGHFAYYSLDTLIGMFAHVGMHVAQAWEFDLYGGTVLIAVRHGSGPADSASVARILQREDTAGVRDPASVATLQHAADHDTERLCAWLADGVATGLRIYAYGASSRSVALLHRAGVNHSSLRGVADASPAKRGRRMPGTDVPIISPGELAAADPDHVLVTVPDLLPELRQQYPELDGRWLCEPPGEEH